MLYMLSLFATEPNRFVKLYEWRKMTEMERCGVGTYWKNLGDALGICSAIRESRLSGWHPMAERDQCLEPAVEEQHMKPHPRNKEIADKTIDVLVYNLPGCMKPLGVYFVSFLMDNRLRKAMMYAVHVCLPLSNQED